MNTKITTLIYSTSSQVIEVHKLVTNIFHAEGEHTLQIF